MDAPDGRGPHKQGWLSSLGQRARACAAAADATNDDARAHDWPRVDLSTGRTCDACTASTTSTLNPKPHIWAKQRHELYAEKRMDTVHLHQTAASDSARLQPCRRYATLPVPPVHTY